MGMDDEKAMLKKMGLDFEMPDAGCCGMAGSFGFERGITTTCRWPCGEQRAAAGGAQGRTRTR